jgi:murein DD-endopeptidase MepM/ murein hydrolase activator NlpD
VFFVFSGETEFESWAFSGGSLIISNVRTATNGWIELTNLGEAVSARELYLSNDADNLRMWRIPAVIIRPGETVRIAANNNSADDVLKRMQANFRPRANEMFYLTDSVGNTVSTFGTVPTAAESQPTAVCDCLNCIRCGWHGGRFGFGHVLGNEVIGTDDAVAIMRHIVGLPSPIADCDDARAAAILTDVGRRSAPTVNDAIAIMRYLAGESSEINHRRNERESASKLNLIFPIGCDSFTQIGSPFGWRAATNSRHLGIDIHVNTREDSDVFAAADGVVTHANWLGTYGIAVIISHGNGHVTLYAHMIRMPDVRVGDTVEQGQIIGQVGRNRQFGGTHLHFEVRVNGVHVDPMPFFRSRHEREES